MTHNASRTLLRLERCEYNKEDNIPRNNLLHKTDSCYYSLVVHVYMFPYV